MAGLYTGLLFLRSADASNTITRVGFVPEPSCGRGTIDILWQCFTTIFLCIYTVPHVDVAPITLSKWHSFWRKAAWVAFGLVAPELVVYKAMTDLRFARKIFRDFKQKYGLTVSMKQAHFLAAGGLRLHLKDDDRDACSRNIRYLFRGNSPLPKRRICAQFLVDNLPSDREIDDMSKTDFLAKIITTAQAVWIATIIVGRAATSLDISLIEVETASYVSLALMAYICWWFKPYGISTSIPLEAPAEFDYLKLHQSNQRGPILTVLNWDTSDPQVDNEDPLLNVPLFLIITVYSGIHCSAWNYAFASFPEAIGWRVSSILVGVTSLIVLALIYVGNRYDTMAIAYVMIVAIVLYILSRLFLIVEVFLAFRSAPIGIYSDFSWTGYVGHIGS